GFDASELVQLLWAPGGKIVALKTFLDVHTVIARFNADGSPDTTFDADGALQLTNDTAAITVAPDGKLLIDEYDDSSAHATMLVRYNADSSIDTSFGVNGISHETFDEIHEHINLI